MRKWIGMTTCLFGFIVVLKETEVSNYKFFVSIEDYWHTSFV